MRPEPSLKHPNSPVFSEHLAELVEPYSLCLIDLWGVLHDGITAYPDALDALRQLRDKKKQVIFLSNAPRRAFEAQKTLDHLGFSRDLYDHIVTSGELTHHVMKQGTLELGSRYYYVGPPKDESLLEGLEYERVALPSQADFALVTGFDAFGDPMEAKLPEVRLCLEEGLPMICPNPDRVVVRQDRSATMLCAGLLGEFYEENGGIVHYYGKPYADIYDYCLSLAGSVDSADVMAIGDSLHTDIAGAKNKGIYAVLVTGGILANDLNITHHELPEPQILADVCAREGTTPDAVLPLLRW